MTEDTFTEAGRVPRLAPRRTQAWRVCRKWHAGILIAAALCGTLLAQENTISLPELRQDQIASRQAEKSKVLQPAEPDKAEQLIKKVESIFLLDPSGFFPYFGSVYQGGGITLGGGYRQFYGDNTFWEVKGLYSLRNYKLVEGGTVSNDHLNKKLSFGTRLGWRDATQVDYYGVGQRSNLEDITQFRFKETYLDGNVIYRPVRWLPIKGSVGYEFWDTLQGEGVDESIESKFTPETAPGLGVDPGYIHSRVSAGIDWRRSPGYSRTGGLYELTFHDYHNTSGGTYSFQKLDAEVIQYIPLVRETWVLAGRGRVETTLNDNDTIPYFLLPWLGSGDTLRGYSSYRFRDRHSMLMNAELRWIPSTAIDMALFYDAGKVTSVRNDLSFKELKSDVGIGARLHGLFATPLRIDFAVGNEGWRFVVSGGPIF